MSYLEPDEDVERITSSWVPILVIVCCTAACLKLGLQGGVSDLGSTKLVLMIYCVVAECLAPATAGLGFIPWALPAYWLLATSTPTVAPTTYLMLVLALSIRTVSRGNSLNERLTEAATDLLCGLFLLLFCTWLEPAKNAGPVKNLAEYLFWALPLIGYWVLWTVAPALFVSAISPRLHRRWTLARERVHPVLAFLITLGLVLALGMRDPKVLYLGPLALVFFLSPVAAQSQLWKLEDEKREAKSSRNLINKEKLALEQEEQRIQVLAKQTLAEEQNVQSQKLVLETVGGLFAEVTRAWGEGFSKQILGTVRQRIPSKTMVLFARRNKQWMRVTSHGSQSDRFDVLLSELDRSVVGEALRSQRTISRAPNAPGSLDRHEYALAIPIDHWGVFYVGDSDPAVLERHTELLRQLAPHLRIYVDAANYYEYQQSALENEAELRKKTEDLAHRLALVLQSLSRLVAESDPKDLLRECLNQIALLVDCHSTSLRWSNSDGEEFSCHKPDTQESLALLQNLTNDWERLEEKTWGRHFVATPASGTGLKLATPSVWHCLRMNRGVLFLIEKPEHLLAEVDFEVVRLFIWQAERLLENANLFWHLQRAHQELQASQSQLVQSSKLAAIGQLAAGVAHELNTPLGAISVAIDGAMMAMDTKPERSKQRLDKAILSVEQMQEIISKLLFYSRESRSGRQEVDINKVIESSVQLIGHLLQLDNFSIQLELGTGLFVLANPNELQQVFTNLLINAKDACLQIGASARQICIRSLSDDQTVVIEVQDSGAGMDDTTSQRIFEPFFTTKPVGQGTGLGLSTSLLLVEEHQGQLQVRSAPGQGATFSIRLPKSRPA